MQQTYWNVDGSACRYWRKIIKAKIKESEAKLQLIKPHESKKYAIALRAIRVQKDLYSSIGGFDV